MTEGGARKSGPRVTVEIDDPRLEVMELAVASLQAAAGRLAEAVDSLGARAERLIALLEKQSAEEVSLAPARDVFAGMGTTSPVVDPYHWGVDPGAPEGDMSAEAVFTPPAPATKPAPDAGRRPAAGKAPETKVPPARSAAPKPAAKPAPAAPQQEKPAVMAVDGGPDWLAPALALCRAAKSRTALELLAREGDLTVQSVIYAFRPPIKETYAQNVLSDVKQLLGQVGWLLERDNTGAYRARVKD